MKSFDPITEPDPSRPGCEAGQVALQSMLDGVADWDSAEASEHRANCVDCREELSLARSFVQLPQAIVPSGLADRVFVAADADRRYRRRARFIGAGFSLAATLLVAAFAIRSRVPADSAIIASGTISPKVVAVEPKPLGDSVAEARDALVQLTKRTANETRERSALFVPKLPDRLEADDRLDPLADASAGAAKSVEPFAASAKRAVTFFLGTSPK